MEIKVTISQAATGVHADAVFYGDTMVVLPGGTISRDFADHIRGGRTAKKYRNDPAYVSDKQTIVKECVFTSPSTAAQFVTGRSTNGYEAWKVEKKLSLGAYLEKHGLR